MNEPRYPYVHVDVSSDDAEIVASRLFELGALGLEERDQTTLARSGGDAAVTLVASFPDEATAAEAHRELAEEYPSRIEHVVGDGWRDGWRAYWKPMRVGERLVVVPSWERYEPLERDIVLALDPGQAFGTGTHETTQLLLGELERRVEPGVEVLDVGCGSGILAIAALKLGAARATALDNDPLAVEATRENAERNGVAAQLTASDVSVERLEAQFALVVANIEARVLVPLAAAIAGRVAAGGSLFLSGLLATDVDAVRAAYPAFRELARPERGDWRALVLAAPREG
ncbi:MAG TPA: 50S ribosomal protein L11 methyltransferase [Polyangiales bacterium]|nr:50S ribosomal protein L11 methyltransferase [Polyangiales bacterium]